ncbi:MAG: DNA ligase D [Nitrospira sp.]|nr:DNA ligase D [Nitrospira sp.]HBP89630.1 DNA ligase D [Nitrospiraceae bacterium]HNP27806.1 DNA ligase D [Nitrospirales bacterium]
MGLKDYRSKRQFVKTPEPRGRKHRGNGSLFVVQEHAASHLHYDFRLELDGVLKSWAVPKGPSLYPSQKRLAVHVEDHPVEYGSFEGNIPKDEYGGGTVLLWDRGIWVPREDPSLSYKRGRLKFHLKGEKLKGGWSLVRMRSGKNERNWLLIKEHDAHSFHNSQPDILETSPLSVATQRSLEEIAENSEINGKGNNRSRRRTHTRPKKNPPSRSNAREKPLGSPKISDPSKLPFASSSSQPTTFQPQLATLVKNPPAGEEWLHEIKFDGYRMLSMVKPGHIRLRTRNGKDWTNKFSVIAGALAELPVRQAILDGEILVLRPDGTSDFQALQNVLKGEASDPLVYYAFDLPYCEGYSLCRTPLLKRKELLRELIASLPADAATHIRYSDHIQGQGQDSFNQACRLALEGLISKQAMSPYRQARSKHWVKVKCQQRQELVIGGYTNPAGSRKYFGALLLGYYDEQGRLHYAGRVGTGFSDQRLARIYALLVKRQQARPPFFRLPFDRDLKKAHWVRPELVAEVEFFEWTREGVLRHPAFIGLREDKSAKEIKREMPMANDEVPFQRGRTSGRRSSSHPLASPEDAEMPLSHPDKVLYPQQGITKRDLAEYYRRLAPWVLPHVAGRPLTLVRCPQGHQKKCFYQKHASDSLSDSIRQILIQEKGTKERNSYLVIDDVKGLLAFVQMGVLEIHPWGCLEDRIDRPDRLVLDLDPGPGVSWEQLIEGAHILKNRLLEDGVESFVKTSGGKGLHVVAPLVRRTTWDDLKKYTRMLAMETAQNHSAGFVATMSKTKRKGKIFIDYLRNGFGATSIATYGTRALSGAPVSTPLAWKELSSISSSQAFTLATLPARLKKIKSDPWKGFFDLRQSLSRSALTF